ncbi:MAG: hypothetical protein A2452_03895 [Candidatus Firestonebacteria bacterium RIFOXYC2_FULL_39_67]|nr:MAG: hypothetical protein A2536_08630 [Candidatus Firestonebacteria bacterium RIFOXYD2_FULL_39_29]OGF53550.1 MAG: hypothetical protein A2497_00520 [Candidatus Firestonebacteria bacterium RifOxyC12_full_39_7]OGF54706.1 MAG: hypothetical protein A2452_03895 [Candidatus Firestonebacteria bacterium RIFOXYC2_FULL_39_67]
MGAADAVICQSETALNVFYNPAGLAPMKNIEVTLGYGKRFMGLTDGSDIGNSSLAVAVGADKLGGFGIAWQNAGLAGSYQENLLIFSCGQQFIENFYLGASLKYYSTEYLSDAYTVIDPLFTSNGYTKKSFGGDVGALAVIATLPLKIGLTISNILQPDFGLGIPDKPPLGIKMGLAYSVDDMNFELDGKLENSKGTISIGGEGWLLQKRLVIRSGFQIYDRGLKQITLGIGYRENQFDFNYSFSYPLSGFSGTAGTHQTSISFRFENPLKSKIVSQLSENGTKVLIPVPEVKTSAQTENISTLVITSSSNSAEENRKLLHEKEESYTVQTGDTLKSLAIKFYNDPKLWTLIYEANKDNIKVGTLVPGTVLLIPKQKQIQ